MYYRLPPLEEPTLHGGWFNSLIRTWIEACFHPVDFFESVGRGYRLNEPLIFGMIIGWLNGFATALISFAIRLPLLALLQATGSEGTAQMIFTVISEAVWIFIMLFLGWLFALIGILVSSLILHLFLFIVGGAKKGLVMTIRTMGYVYAGQIFSIVPLIGWIVAPIYVIVLEIIGLARAHEIEYWRSALAVFLPIILVCCCVFSSFAYLVAILGALAGKTTYSL
ncbi:MAG: hypothetical protein RUDDFDWM_001198 [Candidatus Fervidibacterota bacterium]